LSIDKKQKSFLVTSLMVRTFMPGANLHDPVFHKDGDDSNCALDNLTHERPDVQPPPLLHPDEEWRPCGMPFLGSLYLVSNYGRVCTRKWTHENPNGHVLALSRLDNGYFTVGLTDKNKTASRQLIHRVVAYTFIGEPPEGKNICDHLDRNPANNHVSNLRWVSPKENHPLADDRFQDFKCLSPKDADDIRERYNNGETQSDIAAYYGISQNQVSMCVLGKAWNRKVKVKVHKISKFEAPHPGDEVWKKCPSYPEVEVSNLGAVRFSPGTPKAGLPVTQSKDGHGYLFIQPQINNRRLMVKSHRLVADAFFGPGDGLQVNHKDGNRVNNWVTNLEYVDPKNNQRHRWGYAYETAGADAD
jgi:hypothetical protein